MKRLREWILRIGGLFNKGRKDQEFQEELESHIQMRTEDNLRSGMTPGEARRQAMIKMGGIESTKEIYREQRGIRWLEDTMQDIRFGARQLCKNPGFTAIAILVLALGTGTNATIFSIINSMLIKPVPVNHPEQLVGLYQHDRDNPQAFDMFSFPDFVDLRSAQDAAFSDLFAFRFSSVGFQGDLTERASAEFVTANYFTTLGVPPALGRVFRPEEETSGEAVAVLTDSFWRKLGADNSIIGTKLKLTRGVITVVGVMPKGFSGAQVLAPEIFMPMGFAPILEANLSGQPSRILTARDEHGFMIMGRLKPGLTLVNVNGALAGMNEQFTIPDPANPKPRTLLCAPPSRFVFGSQPSGGGHGLGTLGAFAFALSMLVLIIACLNLANMMIARGTARQKEIAIRLAIGAARGRVLRQLLTEGLLLALLGGIAGLVVSVWAANLLSTFLYSGAGMPSDFPKFDLSPDRRVLMVLLLVSGAATLVFALAPAWKLARLDFHADLKRSAGEDVATGRRGWFRGKELLAMGQMGFTLALLVVAALFTRSAVNAIEANPGFEFGSNFYVSVDTTLAGYPESRVRELIRQATENLSALPGVECASPALNIPLGNATWERHVQIGGAPPETPSAATLAEGKTLEATYNLVGANYFRALGLPVLRGREFSLREVEVSNGAPVAVISQNLADRIWPGEDAVGRTVQFPAWNLKEGPTVMTVVGVVAPVRWKLFDQGTQGEIYVPFGQGFESNLKFHVRVAAGVNPGTVMKEARDELRKFDPQIPITEIKTLTAMHQDGPWVRIMRLGSLLFGAFAVLGLFLSLLGIYGLKAYVVARRTREIGIRMALGADRRDVTTLILQESLWLAVPGLVIGILFGVVIAKFSSRFLYRVHAVDPATFAAVSVALLVFVLLACWFPARRAARVSPMAALRHE